MDNIQQENNYKLYMHTNLINNKKYIGVTRKKPEERWGRNGSHYKSSKHFWNAIQKYGWNNFKHEILFDNMSKDKCYALEQEYIKKYNSNNQNYGYNIASGGIGGNGLYGKLNSMYGVSPKERMDSDTYQKWKENIKKNASKSASRKIICLTTGEIFNSITQASLTYDIQDSDIGSCCRNKLFSAGRHPETKEEMVWQYYDEYELGIVKPEKSKTRFYCLTTNEIFYSAIEASNKYGIPACDIVLCSQGKNAYAGKYNGKVMQWMYYDEFLEYGSEHIEIIDKRIICLNNGLVYDSMADAERKTGICHSNIGQCCMGKTSYAGVIDGEKMVWQYYKNYIEGNLLLYTNKKNRSVICVEDGKIFPSCVDATKYYGVKRDTYISRCCSKDMKHVKDRNGNILHFQYFNGMN